MGKVLLEQWVNLDKDPKWVDGTNIKDVKRVGHLHYEVAFKKAVLASYRVKIKPQANCIAYNTAAAPNGTVEAIRNKNFSGDDVGKDTNLAKKKVQLERNITLPAAGGNEYVVRVQYRGKEQESTHAVVVRRMLFYYSVRMDSAALTAGAHPTTGAAVPGAIPDPAAFLTSMETDYWNPAKNYYIKPVKRDASTIMRLCKTLLMAEEDRTGAAVGNAWSVTRGKLLKEVKSALRPHRPDLQKRKPFCFVAVWCNYIASKGAKLITTDAQSWTGTAFQNAAVTLPSAFKTKLFSARVATQDIYIQCGAELWHALDDKDDTNQNWLESVSVFFVETGKPPQLLRIPKDRVTIGDNAKYSFGGHTLLRINLQEADMQGIKRRIFGQIQGKIKVRVKIRTATDSWTLGFAVPGTNVIVVADKCRWERVSNVDKEYVLNHEFGHKIGMTAQGGATNTFNSENASNTPDAPGSLYGNIHLGPSDDSRQHTGNHCGLGATWTPAAFDPVQNRFDGSWTGPPSCVMFGASGTSTDSAQKNYCASCEPIVRKLDLSNTMLGFKKCVTD